MHELQRQYPMDGKWKRRGVHNISATYRVRDCGGGVLALRQLLVAGTGRLAGWLTRVGGRVHARVAPAVRGCRARQPLWCRIAVARSAADRSASSPYTGFPSRCQAPLPRNMPSSTL
ncbi:unnamed protein product [Arctia plantaginis]|uniref:Uncharacterized protein n=1 Tax=Arctia plantaginis TaxID=874455 RepID=A0A8S1ATR0_ARCPL|nr:unnamed protein product [Arctia plantaginis]